MIPEPTIAASRKVVPSASARLRFSKFTVFRCSTSCGYVGIGAADHIGASAFLGLRVYGVNLPSSAHWIDSPHFALISVTAGLLMLDGRGDAGGPQSIYSAVNILYGPHADSVVGVGYCGD